MPIDISDDIATELAAVITHQIDFPQALSDEAVEYFAALETTGDIDIDSYLMTARYERWICDTGRAVISIALEEDGEVVIHKQTGTPYAEFTYTKGNYRVGHPELLTFYPSQNTSHYVLNRVSRLIKEGILPTPQLGSAISAFGVLPKPELPVVITLLDPERQTMSDELYTCQKDHDEAPVALIGIPMPNGDFTASTPKALMGQVEQITDVKEVDVPADA